MAPVDDKAFAPIPKARESKSPIVSFKLGDDERADLEQIMATAGTTNRSEGIRAALRLAAAYLDDRDRAWAQGAYREGFIAGVAEFKCQLEVATQATIAKLKAHR